MRYQSSFETNLMDSRVQSQKSRQSANSGRRRLLKRATDSIKNYSLHFNQILCLNIPIDSSCDVLSNLFCNQLDQVTCSVSKVASKRAGIERQRHLPVVYMRFTSERFIRSPPAQNQSCRGGQGLSNGIKHDPIKH